MNDLPYRFDAPAVRDRIVAWIRSWFVKNGPDCNAVIGISGGKDSSVVAALCVRALGAERVVGVLMPNGVQSDIDMSKRLVDHLGIRSYTVNIGGAFEALMAEVSGALAVNTSHGSPSAPAVSEQTRINLPARLRMAALYAVSQSKRGRVANTCNLSEDWVGYSTRYGDSAGDFSPLANLTVGEVVAVGAACGLPEVLVHKVPSDGLCGKTDEDNLGFRYADLDRYLRTGVLEDAAIRDHIDALRVRNRFKLELMPSFPYAPASGAPREPDAASSSVSDEASSDGLNEGGVSR